MASTRNTNIAKVMGSPKPWAGPGGTQVNHRVDKQPAGTKSSSKSPKTNRLPGAGNW
jgi:hypothetical protein